MTARSAPIPPTSAAMLVFPELPLGLGAAGESWPAKGDGYAC